MTNAAEAPALPEWVQREGARCARPMEPSNLSTVALAQEWFAELDAAVDAQGLKGYDPFDVKQHPLMRAAQPYPLLRRTTTALGDLAPCSMRRMLGVQPTENPKAYALAAMAKLRLHQLTQDPAALEQAEALLQRLAEVRSPGREERCWGYPFDIRAQGLDTPAGTPIAVLSAIAGQACSLAWIITRDSHHLESLREIAHGMLTLFPRMESEVGYCFAYTPGDLRRVHNANLLVAEHLYRATALGGEESFAEAAEPALEFTLAHQREDGSWPYGEYHAGDPYDPALLAIVDHHHTGFVLRSLMTIKDITGRDDLAAPIRRGFAYYKRHLLRSNGMPVSAHAAWPVDIHACAEAILCPSALSREVLAARTAADAPLRWTYANLRNPENGLPWYRKYPAFTSRIHYPRWGTAWIYYALSEYLWNHFRPRG
jgi:hypothetical protein